MREIASDQIFQLAILTIKDSKVTLEVPTDDADAIVSVRAHSRTIGFFDGLNKLLRMADPMPPQAQHEEPEYVPETL